MLDNSSLRIIIIGAGLGGLAAAFRLAQNGHKVQVLESRKSLTPAGGGIMIRPGASRVLLSWGLGPDFEAVADISPATLIKSVKTGKVLLRNIAVDSSDYPDWGTDRRTAQQILYQHACKAGAKVALEAAVRDVCDNNDSASVTLSNGEIISADLVIAADGIRSRTRSKILADVSSPIDPIIGDLTLCGIRVPVEEIVKNENAKALAETVHLNIWAGEHRYVVGRMSEKAGHWSGLFGITTEPTSQKGLWDEDGDIDFLRKQYAGGDRALVAALDMATACDRWKLSEMPDLPRWTSKHGRVILLGDSAHAMRPNAAQGFSQILEDIAVLDFLLSTQAESNIPLITNIWQTVRKPRAERIKAYAAWNTVLFTGQDAQDPIKSREGSQNQKADLGQIKSLKHVVPDATAKFHSAPFLKWVLDYDAVGEARNYLNKMKAKI